MQRIINKKAMMIFLNVCVRSEENAYCAEPMFIPRPDSKGDESEDDGVIISSMIR